MNTITSAIKKTRFFSPIGRALALAFIAATFFVSPARAQYINGALSITNAPTNGSTITIFGSVRTWVTTVTNVGTQIAFTNDFGAAATNLFNQLALNPINGIQLSHNGTNGINVAGIALTMAVSTNWASLTFTTNSLAPVIGVVVPWSTYGASNQVYVASQVITGLENSTNAFAASSPALTNHVGLSTAQTVTGAKIFSGANTYSNANQKIVGGQISNAVNSSFTASDTTHVPILIQEVSSTATNALEVRDASGTIRFSVDPAGDLTTGFIIGNIIISSGGIASTFVSTGGLFVTNTINTSGLAANGALITSLSAGDTVITNGLQVIGLQTNLNTTGTNVLLGSFQFPRANNTSLANGGNASINIGTNVNVFISGPSAAFSTDGIAGGLNGQIVELTSRIGQTWTIPNESGFDATPGNRIQTGTGATITITNNPAWAEFKYDSTAARWILRAHSN